MQTRIYALAASAVCLLALTLLASSAGAFVRPTYGKPPIPGKYVFDPDSQGELGDTGSLMLKKHGPHGYTVVNLRITLPEGCKEYAGMVARVTRNLHPKRFVAHRTAEN
ncbi:MAG: hypothetical protein ACREJM_05780, partial [Candidatus Saccharimonadales bacterium]